jgi:TonB family protein
MKPLLLLPFLIFFTSLFAQKTESYYDFHWRPVADASRAAYLAVMEKKDSGWSRKDYFLREGRMQMDGFYKDEDCKVPHGNFRNFFRNGRPKSLGRYVDGKRYGTWLSFHENGVLSDSATYIAEGILMGTRMGWHANGYLSDSTVINPDGSGVAIHWWDNGNPSVAGLYAPGFKKQGKWKYFHQNGQLASLETYNADVLVNKEYFDEKGVPQSDTTTRDGEAVFPGGMKAWGKYLSEHLYFPAQYKFTNDGQVTVLVRFAVNEDGSVSDVEVTSSFHKDFDQIAVNIIKRSPKWIPASSHNRKLKEYHEQPVTFAQTSE